jgi:YcxB-like protein
VKFTYAATARDRYRVIRTITTRQRGWQLFIGGTWVVIAVIAIGELARGRPVVPLLVTLLPWTFIAGISTALLPAMWYLGARGAVRNAMVRGDHTIELAEGGLRESGQVTATVIRWSAIVRVVETADFFLFYYTKSSAFYLPLSAVPPTDLGAVRAFLSAHVPADRTELAGRPVTA